MVGVVKGTGIAETPLSDIDATPGGQVSDAYGGQTCAVSESSLINIGNASRNVPT